MFGRIAYNLSIVVMGAACVPLAFVPYVWSGPVLGLASGISLVLLAVTIVVRPHVAQRVFAQGLVWLPVMFVVLISSILTDVGTLAFFGGQYEWGTAVSIILIAVAGTIGAVGGKFARSVILWAVGICGALASSMILAQWATGLSFLPPFAPSAWPNLSVAFVGAAAVSALLFDDAIGPAWRLTFGTSAVLSLIGGALLYIPAVALLGTVVMVLASLLARRGVWTGRWPFASILLAVALGALYIAGPAGPLVPVDSTVRPSFVSTMYVIGSEYIGSPVEALLGSGSGSFARTWNENRPLTLNTTILWDYTPESSYSAATNVLIEFGLLGFFALLLLPGIALSRSYSRDTDDDDAFEVRTLAVLVLGLVVFLAGTFLAVSTALMALGAFSLGNVLHLRRVADNVSERSAVYLVGSWALIIVMLTSGLGFGYASVRQMRATQDIDVAYVLALSGDQEAARAHLTSAARTWGMPKYWREASYAFARNTLLERSVGTALPLALDSGRSEIDELVELNKELLAADPYDLATQLYLATLYIALAERGIEEALSMASIALDAAARLAPNRPDVSLYRAKLELLRDDPGAAREAASRAVSLKPDYAEAHDLLGALSRGAR